MPESKLIKEIGVRGRGGLDAIKTGLTYQDLLDMPCPSKPPTFDDWVRCARTAWVDDREASDTDQTTLHLPCTA